jgi:hypothetical protein
MLQKPFFIETKIRIKLPNDTIWEASFTPKETLQDVYNLFKLVCFSFDMTNYKNLVL